MANGNIYKCFSCGLVDKLVEAGGRYYCPNPFCEGCGSTSWKRENLVNVCTHKDGTLELNDDAHKEWLHKGIKAVKAMPYSLASKILRLKKTRNIISLLKQSKGRWL